MYKVWQCHYPCHYQAKPDNTTFEQRVTVRSDLNLYFVKYPVCSVQLYVHAGLTHQENDS